MNPLQWNEQVNEAVTKRLQLWQQRSNESPMTWVTELIEYLNSVGVELPSCELVELLVSQICSENGKDHPSMWKFLHQALTSRLVFPLQLISLLSYKVFRCRNFHPHAYALFLPLLHQHVFNFHPIASHSCNNKIIKSIDSVLHFSETFKIHDLELGHVFVLFFFNIIIALIDSTLNDWGLQVTFNERSCLVPKGDQYMEIDHNVMHNFKKGDYHEQIRKRNAITALEVLGRLSESRKATILLQSVLLNMPENFNCLLQRLQFLESLELASSELKLVNQVLRKVSTRIRGVSHFDYSLNKHQVVGMIVDVGSCKALLNSKYRSCWVPLDIYMENAMNSRQIPIKSAIEVLTEGIKTLQIFNQASWHETFLALWLSALRLVQRERDPPEGPIPHLEARLCMLLSIVPLAIVNVLRDDTENNLSTVPVPMRSQYKPEMKSDGSIKLGLTSSVQVLGHFSGLLCPPALVVDAANQAAKKAASFIYNSMNEKGESFTSIHANANTKAGGNLRHLIVEACIARNLMDTSVYFWPGYVSTSVMSLSDSSPLEKSPWLTFMDGTPLNNSLINALTATPASSLAEIEKLYYIALNGTEVERPAAAKILCGASLSRGWYIQEHVVRYVVKLLASPVPHSHSGTWGLLVDNMSMLSAVLRGASCVDTVHILSLHGVVPTVAASLLPLCEAFGSITPTPNSTGDEPSTSVYMAFSLAFLFLIRLWKFCTPPLDQCITEGGIAVGGLEYLLTLHNNCVMSSQDKLKSNQNLLDSAFKPVSIDSFPKLRALYCQYKSCVASTLSGISTGNSSHQTASVILSMIYQKMSKGGISSSNCSSPNSSNACSSLINSGDDALQRPVLPAWEVLEALPFVLEAILTACVHGRLSSRDLTTGLRHLVDFLPASIAAIIDYFSSEVTRGVWKQVPMNGTDWPSPAAVLQSVESEIKAILTHVGVEVPNCSSGGSPVMLPLPMAALVSLSITFKLDKSLEYIHAITGAALENCASGCPWPSMPVIGSLWAQKVRRWHNFIVVSGSRSVFRHNNESVAQLVRSCFTSFLGVLSGSNSKLTAECSVNGLLGSSITAPGAIPFVAPGFLYLRSCRNIHNVQYLNDVIVGLVTEYSNELAGIRASSGSSRLKSNETSISLAAQSAKDMATLGASLLCAAGGIQLVQELYKETIPTWLLSSRDVKRKNDNVVSYILEGYAIAYLLTQSGAILWGVGTKLPSSKLSRRNRIIGVHLDFLAEVMERKISLSCNPLTWKTYVCCLVGLMVSFAPAWLQEVKVDTLRKLARGLSRWNEHEQALSLLQRGGTAAMGALAELVNVIDFEHKKPCS
ncbi:mediator of RNA polymerase II transcription subunit 33A-like isoform X2 [Trifolium pratense]|uniref:mediator of RNA polymerase II transcription subunit 33A-like isoform X2 n=2 Tax=Trifolium pratense TaxID=57577 RepID=UPI001E692EA5|nr:mediator of RNA polymerase II transcription subunit 33A-like isoform X2 [Trifolium pratense]